MSVWNFIPLFTFLEIARWDNEFNQRTCIGTVYTQFNENKGSNDICDDSYGIQNRSKWTFSWTSHQSPKVMLCFQRATEEYQWQNQRKKCKTYLQWKWLCQVQLVPDTAVTGWKLQLRKGKYCASTTEQQLVKHIHIDENRYIQTHPHPHPHTVMYTWTNNHTYTMYTQTPADTVAHIHRLMHGYTNTQQKGTHTQQALIYSYTHACHTHHCGKL